MKPRDSYTDADGRERWDRTQRIFYAMFGDLIDPTKGLAPTHSVAGYVDRVAEWIDDQPGPLADRLYCHQTWLSFVGRDQPNPVIPEQTIAQSYREEYQDGATDFVRCVFLARQYKERAQINPSNYIYMIQTLSLRDFDWSSGRAVSLPLAKRPSSGQQDASKARRRWSMGFSNRLTTSRLSMAQLLEDTDGPQIWPARKIYEQNRSCKPEFARRDCPTTKTEKTTATDQEDGTRLIETVTTKKSGEIQLISGELGTPRLAGPKCRRQLGTNGASIPRANKTIYNEAIAMLYGQNQFSLKSLSLTEFIKMLGDRIKALRHCKLDYINGYHQALRINLLADAENLQVLEIYSGVSTYCKTLEHVYGLPKEPVVAFVSRGMTDVQRQDRFSASPARDRCGTLSSERERSR
ncbi:hypothetical protein LTR22_027243 [Elasticomyces elasticus]|nr:hypothetical protein LTR22_027243 [Elasticomyces elasticus]